MQPTLGQVWNLLWQAVSNGPAYYLGLTDDYTVAQFGWDDVVRETLGQFPDGIAFEQIPDPSQEDPDQVTLPAATAG